MNQDLQTNHPPEGQKNLRRERSIRMTAFALCALFVLSTMLKSILVRDAEDILICMATLLLLRLPHFLERKLHCRISIGVYVFSLLYIICPVLGNVFQFYYILPWWDKFMHGTGGVVLAMLGLYLPYLLNPKGENSLLLCALFGLFFSISMSVLWEFYEYAVDSFVGNDMQKDAYVYQINSYLLSDEIGKMRHIQDIGSVTLNGEALRGYVDIGLHDTMLDLLLECGCALLYVLYYVLKKGRNPAFRPLPQGRAR